MGMGFNLRDDDAAAFFDAFYRHLGEGRSVAASLSGAQRDSIAADAPAAAWAPFVVLGDGEVVPLPGGRPRTFAPWGWAALAAAVLAVVLIGYRMTKALQMH